MDCDNQAAIHIAVNLIFQERTRCIKVDSYFVRDEIKAGIVKIAYVHIKSQLADVFAKILVVSQHVASLGNFGLQDIFHLPT